MNTQTTAWTVLADATMEAAVRHLLLSDDKDSIDCDKLTKALKTTLKSNIDETLKEWEDMVTARMTETQLRWAVNIQANALAAEAIKTYRVM